MAAQESDDRYRPKLFYEDVVSRQKVGLIQYGVVVASFLESDEEDDEEFEPQVKLKRGHVRVTWYPDGQREVVPEAKLHLVDRSLMPRDFVRRHTAGQDSQGGTVLNTDITVDLQIIGTNKVIPGVNSKKLKPLQRILPYEYVVYGVWLGRVRDVNAHLILRLSNGARCSMWVGDAAQLEDIRVQSDLALKEVNVEWQTRGFSPPKKQPSELDEDLKPPEAAIQGDNINNLRKPEHFMYTHITFGDRAVYRLTEEDLGKVQACELSSSIVAKCDTLGGAVSEFCSGLNGIMADISGTLELVNKVEKDLSPQAQNNSISESDRLKSDATHTNRLSESQTTTVKLLNGEVDSDGQLLTNGASVGSGKTIPSSGKAAEDSSKPSVLEDKDFIADDEEDLLTDDDNADSECSSSTASSRSSKGGRSKRLGVTLGVKTLKKAHRRVKKRKKRGAQQEWIPGDVVPVEVVNVSTLVDVMWQDSTIEHGIPANELAPIQHCDEHEFCPGDFIVDKRVVPKKDMYGFVRTVDHKARTCQIQWQEAAPGHPQGFLTHEEEEVSAYDLGDHPDYTYRIGDLVVRIADSTQAACRTPTSEKPCIGQVLRTNGDGSLAVVWIDNSVSSVPPQDLYRVDSEDEGGWSGDDSEWESVDSDEDWETDSDPASGDEVDGKLKSAEKPKEKKKDKKESTSSPATKPSHEQKGTTRTQEPVEEVTSPEEEVMSPEEEVMSPCSQVQEAKWVSAKGEGFSVSETCPVCHKFRDLDFGPANMKSFFSNIKKELTLLSTSLPEGILVKTFEDRMDLFSVAIKGPHNTPYEDGLFLFDLKLPDAYPLIPPLLHYLAYHSGRLNPNLYEDGKGTEKWTKDSNLLQVLVSIQGLILVSEPYYNEAGFEKDKGSQEGLENSRCYNEMVLLKMVQTMSKMTLNPPDIFKEEIIEHCRQHGHRMIQRLESWLELSETDSPNGAETKANSDSTVSSINKETTTSEHQQASAASNQPLTRQSSTTVAPSGGNDQPKTTMLPKTDHSVVGENQSSTNRDQPTTSSKQAAVTSISQQPACATSSKNHSSTSANQSGLAEVSSNQLGINFNSSEQTDSNQSSVGASKLPPTTDSMCMSEVFDGSGASQVSGVTLSPNPPGFPLFPLSKGFRMSLRSHLVAYRSVLHKLGIQES
uniref:E2/E3 hybrid ubiquitin-protein ligase UBE2O n=1 Tax=Branchiostoma floridae TaxID=7739 RepID=C3Z6Y3_BRAFL|eukprot:XP_002595567.1 hypothetical protein BRAFLDRAFT_117489 [Branchiostoma floridae]